MSSILSTRHLFERYSATVMVSVLVGDFKPSQALRLASQVWEQFPALFPDFADDLLTCGARSACWSLAQMLAEMPGSWDLWVQARDIAHESIAG